MLFLTADRVKTHLQHIGLSAFMDDVIQGLEGAFAAWPQYQKSPRHATHYPHGVIELMPCSDQSWYGFKYVNGHPKNAQEGRLNIVGFGVLSEVDTGFPCMLTDMTYLTAIRTACMTALVAKYGMLPGKQALGIIGCGAQSEFQCLAMARVMDLKTIYYHDIDPEAMTKFANNMASTGIALVPCDAIAAVCEAVAVLITATAYKGAHALLQAEWLRPGTFIAGVGGDCPGKTEFSKDVLSQFRIVVEYLPQSKIEGEIQHLDDVSSVVELHQVITGAVTLRQSDQQWVFFDSVGFALEDLVIMRVLYAQYGRMHAIDNAGLIPEVPHAKNLYGALMSESS